MSTLDLLTSQSSSRSSVHLFFRLFQIALLGPVGRQWLDSKELCPRPPVESFKELCIACKAFFKGPCKAFFLRDLQASLQVQVSAQGPALPEEKL